MSIVSKVTAYGTPGVVAVGACAIWGQTLLQWVTQPSHLLPVAAVSAVTALGIAKRKGKVEPETPAPTALPTPTAEQAQAYLEGMRAAQSALPQGQAHVQPQAHARKVIDLGHVER
jgi:hypothetical protein